MGYYRVNYDEDHWATLIANIKEMEITDRTHLIEETFRLAESGELSYDIPLNLTKELDEETHYIPLSALSKVLKEIKLYLSSSQYLAQFQVSHKSRKWIVAIVEI